MKKNHSNKNQCGLCDKCFETSTILNDHLTQCDVYMCSNSGCRDTFETLNEMKEHINIEHRKNSPAHYSFSYWIVDSKDRSEKEINNKLHSFILGLVIQIYNKFTTEWQFSPSKFTTIYNRGILYHINLK